MPYVPSEEEWLLALNLEQEHYDRVAQRSFAQIEIDRRIHDSLLRKKRQAEREAAEKARAERMALARTYDQALRGKAGLDFLPDQKCQKCGGMPYFNGARFIEHHDQSICKPMGPTIIGDPGHRSTSTGLSRVDTSSFLQRARRVTGDNDDD